MANRSGHLARALVFFRENRGTTILLVAISFLVATVFVVFDGGFTPAAALAVLFAIGIISVFRLDWGFCIFIGVVLSLDQFEIRGFQAITYEVSYFLNLNLNPYLPQMRNAVVSPLELHLLFLIAIWGTLLAIKQDVRLQPISVWFSFVLFIAWVLFAFISGLVSGGDLLFSLWEIRAIGYFALVYFLAPQIIRTPQQLKTLFWVIIAGISVKAFQGVSRFVMGGLSFQGADLLTNSEDPTFIVTLVLFLLALTFIGGEKGQKNALMWLFPILIGGIYCGQRRASYVSLAISILGLVLLLPQKERKTILRGLAVLTVLFGIYLAFYWNTYGRIGVIAQQFKSTIGQTDPNFAGADYLSNLYREYENYNLAVTIQRAPLIGIGFGNPYDSPLKWFNMLETFSLLKYIPHDSWLWLFSKMGAIGFFFFCFFFNIYLFKGGREFSKFKNPYLKAICAVCLLAVINQMVVAYVEMQLSFYRPMIYLACLMGLLPVLIALDRQPPGTDVLAGPLKPGAVR